MVWTTVGKEFSTFILGGSMTAINSGSWWIAIGTGSKTISSTVSGLVTEADRNQITGSVDTSTAQRLTWTVDYNSIEMSGIQLTEFGLFHVSSGNKSWIQEGFAAVSFDGTEELQTEIVGKVY